MRLQFTPALAAVHDDMFTLSRRAYLMTHRVQPLAAAAATMSSLGHRLSISINRQTSKSFDIGFVYFIDIPDCLRYCHWPNLTWWSNLDV